MSWDWEQMFTPPTSKSPWTAMTHGSTDKWAKGLEKYGPLIQTASSYFPWGGTLIAAAQGAGGLGGRGTGYIGSDYGDANWGTTIGGAVKGMTAGGNWLGAGMSIYNGTMQENSGVYDSGENPPADKYNSSWYGGVLSGIGNNLGTFGGRVGGNAGGQIGGQIGGQLGIFNAPWNRSYAPEPRYEQPQPQGNPFGGGGYYQGYTNEGAPWSAQSLGMQPLQETYVGLR